MTLATQQSSKLRQKVSATLLLLSGVALAIMVYAYLHRPDIIRVTIHNMSGRDLVGAHVSLPPSDFSETFSAIKHGAAAHKMCARPILSDMSITWIDDTGGSHSSKHDLAGVVAGKRIDGGTLLFEIGLDNNLAVKFKQSSNR